jgi:hypothetical protein
MPTYNAILERGTLNAIEAVVSTYHLMMKFPTERGIGEERGHQRIARECYSATLKGKGDTWLMWKKRGGKARSV